jgi:hypothetical protein
MSEPPRTKEEVMSQIAGEWAALMDTVKRLSAEQILRPDEGGWSPKDNLAHLAEWMKVLMGYHMDNRPQHEVMGLDPGVTAGEDFDVMNQHLLERNRGRSVEDVLDELHRVYGQLTARLEAMSFEDLMKPRREDDPEKQPLLDWVLGDSAEHFAEHRETIEKSI